MSRSIHQTRKAAQRAFAQGNLEPIKEYSLKSDIKKWSKKTKAPKLRNSVLVSAIKKVKKPLNWKLDKKYK